VTAPEVKRAAKSWAMPLLLGLLAVGIAVNFALLIPALRREASQAQGGHQARVTQCAREPIFRKLIVAGEHYHLLSARDVQTFKRTAPDCTP
jgi:hypothetical protein